MGEEVLGENVLNEVHQHLRTGGEQTGDERPRGNGQVRGREYHESLYRSGVKHR